MITDSFPILFIGLAPYIRPRELPFPVGPLDLYELSRYKSHFIYPVSADAYWWVFFVHENCFTCENQVPEIQFHSNDGKLLWQMTLHSENSTKAIEEMPQSPGQVLPALKLPRNQGWTILYIKTVGVIPEPVTVRITGRLGERQEIIGSAEFIYQPAPQFSHEEIKAIEANPESVKSVRIILGCQHCPSKLRAYSQFGLSKQLESEGWVYQHNLQELFSCECGRTSVPLKYLRESLHGLLGREMDALTGEISYERRYGHQAIIEIVKAFKECIDSNRKEAPVQRFLEENLILLARFHPKKIFVKPSVLGKFQADFAILDTSDRLLLIELERPALRLFKKNGHPTADLIHAYEQVRDWLHEYARHRAAVLDVLKIDRVKTVRGVVICGRSRTEVWEHLQRHLSEPGYPNIEFLTYDDLSESLLQISRGIARSGDRSSGPVRS